jgi:HEPN domain-containing protein
MEVQNTNIKQDLKHPEINELYRRWDVEEPERVQLELAAFFLDHTVNHTQEMLFKLYHGWLQYQAVIQGDIHEIDDVYLFHERLSRLVVAAYVRMKEGEAMENTAVKAVSAISFLDIAGGVPEELLPALQLLVKVVDPDKIFLYRYPNGAGTELTPRIELLMMVKDGGQKFANLQPYLDLAMLGQRYCKVKLFLRSRLAQAFKDGDLYYLLCCKPEYLIYNQSKEALPLIDALQLQERREGLQKLFDFSGGMAKSFLEHAKMNKAQGDWRMAIFMLQQCAECCCRAVIKGFTGEERKTHEISVLAKQLDMIAPKMRMALGGDEAKDVRLLKLLDAAYAKARYLESFEVSNADLDRLFVMVDLLFVETGNSFGEMLGLGGE